MNERTAEATRWQSTNEPSACVESFYFCRICISGKGLMAKPFRSDCPAAAAVAAAFLLPSTVVTHAEGLDELTCWLPEGYLKIPYWYE